MDSEEQKLALTRGKRELFTQIEEALEDVSSFRVGFSILVCLESFKCFDSKQMPMLCSVMRGRRRRGRRM